MGVFHWLIKDNHLAIADENTVLSLSAEEVYQYWNGGSFGTIELHPLENELPNLRRSKIGASLKAKVSFDSKEQHLLLQIFALRKNKEYPLTLENGHIVDQGIEADQWFYVSGDTATLEKILGETENIVPGPITVRQLLLLRERQAKEKADVIDFDYKETKIKSLPPNSENLPEGLVGLPYPYQKVGYGWLSFMIRECAGCVLADEMGLGKTLEVILLFLSLVAKEETPILVIAPVSLLDNWKAECAKFAPNLDVVIHHGPNRTGFYKDLLAHDVVIVSYACACNDLSLLQMIKWSLVVLDEAQNIKNPYSERAKSVRKIPRKASLAMSGTPFENHILDIWSLIDFVLPGFLGTIEDFRKTFSDDHNGAIGIEPIITPVMLRRLVKDVADDLPDKIVIPQAVSMCNENAVEYERLRVEANGSAHNPDKIVLGALTKLRMFCAYPSLAGSKTLSLDPSQSSIKYQRFCELLAEIIANGEKIIVFTSFKKMFDIFDSDIPKRFGIPIWDINGETPVQERQTIVDLFNSHDGPAMLALNPRAAGTGLNITGANHVIHYNLEWNPALEDQASARAYRHGQKKTVFVYRLYYKNTVEELVNERLERKRQMASDAIVGSTGTQREREDVIRALSLSPLNR